VIIVVLAASFLPLLLVAILGQQFWRRRMGLKESGDS